MTQNNDSDYQVQLAIALERSINEQLDTKRNALWEVIRQQQPPEFNYVRLNDWIEGISRTLDAQPALAYVDSKYTSLIQPENNTINDAFGDLLKGGQQMTASGASNDCLIHSFLTAISNEFQKLPLWKRNIIADMFRRRLLPDILSGAAAPAAPAAPAANAANADGGDQKYDADAALNGISLDAIRKAKDIFESSHFLSDDEAQILANLFSISIIMVVNSNDARKRYMWIKKSKNQNSNDYIVISGDHLHFTPVKYNTYIKTLGNGDLISLNEVLKTINKHADDLRRSNDNFQTSQWDEMVSDFTKDESNDMIAIIIYYSSIISKITEDIARFNKNAKIKMDPNTHAKIKKIKEKLQDEFKRKIEQVKRDTLVNDAAKRIIEKILEPNNIQKQRDSSRPEFQKVKENAVPQNVFTVISDNYGKIINHMIGVSGNQNLNESQIGKNGIMTIGIRQYLTRIGNDIITNSTATPSTATPSTTPIKKGGTRTRSSIKHRKTHKRIRGLKR